jgi:hypothetical protein
MRRKSSPPAIPELRSLLPFGRDLVSLAVHDHQAHTHGFDQLRELSHPREAWVPFHIGDEKVRHAGAQRELTLT